MLNRTRSGTTCLVFLGLMFTAVSATAADETKPAPAKPGPPRIVLLQPLALEAGGSGSITVRGLNLTDATRVEIGGASGAVPLEIKERGGVAVPEGMDTNKVGDHRLVVSARVPESAAVSRIQFTVVTPDGVSAPHPLVVFPKGQLIPEVEPNNGFRQAQEIRSGQTVLGTIDSPTDVDVFAFRAEAGATLRAEIQADRLGSPLDSSLTLYSEQGQIVAVNDDGAGAGRDSILTWKFKQGGRHFLAVSGVTEKGGPLHTYLLTVTIER